MQFQPKIDRFSADLLIPGKTTDERGWIVGDGVIEGMQGPIQRTVSIDAIRQAAARYEQVGLVDVGDYHAALAEAEAAREEVLRLQEENEALQTKLDAIVGLRREGFVIQKRQGRPPVKKQEATA